MKINSEMDNVEYRSGWKPVTREGIDQISVITIPGKTPLNTGSTHKNPASIDHSKNDSKAVAQNDDISTILSKLESYKEEINQKLDNISTELNTLITLILEASAQEPDKKPKGIRKLFRRNPDIK